MEIDYWIAHSDSFLHQIFMIVMGGLYAMGFLAGVSYKAINIYCYFILFPLSFALFLKTRWKYLFLPVSLLFFVIPGFEGISVNFFNHCVVFLNKTAETFSSNYIAMSVYLCVLVPLIIYLPFLFWRLSKRQLKISGLIFACLLLFYLIFIYPFFKDLLIYGKDNFM